MIALSEITATAVTRQMIALAEKGGLRPRVDGIQHGATRIIVNGPGQDALFGAIYVGARTGTVLRAVLTHGNWGEEKWYDSVAEVRAVLKSWLALQGHSRTATISPATAATSASSSSGKGCRNA